MVKDTASCEREESSDLLPESRVPLRYAASNLLQTGWELDLAQLEELARSIEAIGRGLDRLRVEPGDRVAIFSENRPEWVCFDLAVQSVGAISVPIYAESSSKQAEFILKNSGALVVAVGTTIQMERVLSSRPNLPTLRAAVLFDETSQSVDEFVHPLSEVHTKAREVPSRHVLRANRESWKRRHIHPDVHVGK